MSSVDRTSVAGARYLDLQRKARQTGRPTDELIQLYALECFLDRLTRSEYAQKLVLKGGVLLAALDARRPTRDIDLAATALRNTEAEILGVVRKIAGISLADGIAFEPEQATAEAARASKINLSATLEQALIEKLREAEGRRWWEENRESIAAYNQHVEKHGVFSDDSRSF